MGTKNFLGFLSTLWNWTVQVRISGILMLKKGIKICWCSVSAVESLQAHWVYPQSGFIHSVSSWQTMSGRWCLGCLRNLCPQKEKLMLWALTLQLLFFLCLLSNYLVIPHKSLCKDPVVHNSWTTQLSNSISCIEIFKKTQTTQQQKQNKTQNHLLVS